MPFGDKCEHADMEACVAALTGQDGIDDPEAVCAALMRDTEEG